MHVVDDGQRMPTRVDDDAAGKGVWKADDGESMVATTAAMMAAKDACVFIVSGR